jgi:zinc transport system ATP-binding protein
MTPPPDGAVVLDARGLEARADGRLLFRRLDVTVRAGELVRVAGGNGSGKSTLLRILLGLRPPEAGEVKRAAGLRVGYVPQADPGETGPPFSVASVVSQAWTGSWPRRRRREILGALALAGCAVSPRRRYDTLSGGERRRVLLARALARIPGLLVLDEPTAAMDQAGEAEAVARVEEAVGRGAAAIWVSHGGEPFGIPVRTVRLGPEA